MKLGCVPYINAIPLLYGLHPRDFEIITRPPAELYRLLKENKVDAALMPIVNYFEDRHLYLFPNIAIASRGPVMSVKLVLEKNASLESLHQITLDAESKTSQLLTKCWLQERMGKKLEDIEFKIGLEHKTQASLLIGDKALQNLSRGTEYDLGKEWNDWQQIPFTYAAWMSLNPSQSQLCQALQSSRDLGLKNIQQIISEIKNYPEKLLTEYFTKALNYYMDESSLKGIQQFYQYYQSIEGDTHELDFKFVRES